MPPRVVLIGSPGAGKTSVGRRLAERLQLPFQDTDRMVESQTGSSIADLFVERGEEAFRVLEAEAVARGLDECPGVLALGGGAPMRPETQERLRGHRVVWLKVSLSDAAHRVGMNQARPLLLGNVRGQLAALLQKREPVYEAVATDIIDTSGKSVRVVTDEVLEAVSDD